MDYESNIILITRTSIDTGVVYDTAAFLNNWSETRFYGPFIVTVIEGFPAICMPQHSLDVQAFCTAAAETYIQTES